MVKNEGGTRMNRLGIFLRKLRIEHNEVLLDMAQRLHVSAAFLSAVENDRRSAPPSWVDIIAVEYHLELAQQQALAEAVAESVKQIRVDVGTASPSKRNCALAFARSFDDLSDDDVQGLMTFLERRNPK